MLGLFRRTAREARERKAVRFSRVANVSAWVALGLAVAAGAYLAFGPAYQGVEVEAVAPGESSVEVGRFTATFIEVNGLRAVPLLLVPVVLSGLAVWAVHARDAGRIQLRASLWMFAVALLGLCAVTFLSIGLLYLPTAIALLAAAITGSREKALS